MRSKHQGHHLEFLAAIPQNIVDKWKKMVKDWDVDHTQQNPYVDAVTSKLLVPFDPF
jgi:hypothetical protein